MTEIYIDFTVRSELCNVELSDLLNLSKCGGHKIDDVSKRGIKLNYSEWVYNTKTYKTCNVNDVVENFYHLILPKIEQLIRKLTEIQASVSICFVVRRMKEDNISLALDNNMVKFCSELNASIDFDGIE